MYHVKLPPYEIEIDLHNIISNMGYNNENTPSGLEELLFPLYTKFYEIIIPEYGYTIPNPNNTKQFRNKIILNDITFYTGRKIASRLENIEGCVLFVLTVGNKIDDWIKKLVDEDDIYSTYLIDLIASEYVEKLSDWIEAKIKVKLGKNIGISYRYGPGYCDWDLTEQGKLFNYFPNNFCGISLSEKSIMKPHKSLSGLIGFGENVVPTELPCDVCTDFICHRNRNKNRKNNKTEG